MVMNIQELFDRLKGLDGRLAEDEVYRIVWEETQSGNFDPAAQARAAVEVGTDKEALRAAYIKHRVRRIYDELEAEKNRFQAEEIELERSNKENERRQKEEDLSREQVRKEEALAKERKRKEEELAAERKGKNVLLMNFRSALFSMLISLAISLALTRVMVGVALSIVPALNFNILLVPSGLIFVLLWRALYNYFIRRWFYL